MKKQFSARAIQRASATKPVPEQLLVQNLQRINEGLHALQHDDGVQLDAWHKLSDAVNILASLGELGFISDPTGEIDRTKNVMGEAGERYLRTGTLRLTGAGIQTVRQLLEDYEDVVRGLSERQFLTACRNAEKRINQIRRGHVCPNDKVVGL